MRRFLVVLALGLLALSPAWAAPRPHLDLGFEDPECSNGWYFGPWWTTYQGGIDTSVVHSGAQSVALRATPGPWNPQTGYASFEQDLEGSEFAGKRVRLSGYVRTEGITVGAADLFLGFLTEDGGFYAVDSSAQGATGTTPWTRHTIEIDVPENTEFLILGMELYGNGAVFFDDFEVEVNGHHWADGPARLNPPSAEAVDWLRQNAIAFDTVEARHGFADLQPLKNVIGDARIVSLGEGTHGTREFFQMKHRLLEFLATEMGFTHFAIEANMPEAYRVNEYVLTGVGDPAELLEGMYFWTWNTQEVLDMILWMREYNASGRGPIQFTGFDMQYSRVAVPIARAFLMKAEPDYVPVANSAFAKALVADQTRRVTLPTVAEIRAVFEHMSGKRADYLASFPKEEVEWAIQNARIVLQSVESMAGITSRDESMATNAAWILDNAPAGSKIVLWAHNGHVNKKAGLMGDYLDERYGDDMYVLGFALGEGRYNAVGPTGLTSQEASPPPPGALEAFLEAAALPRFILDLNHLGEDAPGNWLKKRHGFRSTGAVAFKCPFYPTIATEEYDGLIWINPTNPSVLLPFD
ncbi:MAG TPA: erythromycin esterase family protein [Thermoanaerobaculia bacterium]|nr:erythromycin esterase family protein [Thermoanaerobaculia bacterium]